MDTPAPVRFATARALVTDQLGRWLLVRDDRPYWYLPGGWVKPRERPSAACRRELFEETGLHADVGELLVIACRDDRWSLIFDCGSVDSDAVVLTPDNNPEPVRVSEYRWAPSPEALYLLKPQIAERMVAWLAHLGNPGPAYVE